MPWEDRHFNRSHAESGAHPRRYEVARAGDGIAGHGGFIGSRSVSKAFVQERSLVRLVDQGMWSRGLQQTGPVDRPMVAAHTANRVFGRLNQRRRQRASDE